MIDQDSAAVRTRGRNAGKGRRGGYRGKGRQVHPLKLEMKGLARTYGPEVLETLLKIIRDESNDVEAHIVAANCILDRGFGKPVAAEAERTGEGQMLVNVISGARGSDPLQNARFVSDVVTVARRPLLPDGRDPFEDHATKPAPQSARPARSSAGCGSAAASSFRGRAGNTIRAARQATQMISTAKFDSVLRVLQWA